MPSGPLEGQEHVLYYLARYTHRVAISDHRLLSFADGNVSFRWKDYAHGNTQRQMTLTGHEFLRRFLLHIPDVYLLAPATSEAAITKANLPVLIASRSFLRAPIPPIPLIHQRLQHPSKYQKQLLYSLLAASAANPSGSFQTRLSKMPTDMPATPHLVCLRISDSLLRYFGQRAQRQ